MIAADALDQQNAAARRHGAAAELDHLLKSIARPSRRAAMCGRERRLEPPGRDALDLRRSPAGGRAPRAARPGRCPARRRGSKPLTTGLMRVDRAAGARKCRIKPARDEGLADIGAGRGDEDSGHRYAVDGQWTRRMRSRTSSASRSISASGCCAVKVEPQARGARRHGRRPDGDDQEAVLLQQPRGRQRRLGLAEHHRHDRAHRLRQPGARAKAFAFATGSAA